MIAMPCHRDLSPQTAIALLESQYELQRMGISFGFEITYGSSLVQVSRSKIAARFLKSEHTHLFWVDSDIVWTIADFMRLIVHCTTHDIVGAIYTAKQDPPLFMSCAGYEPGSVIKSDEYGCLPIDGMGLGFTIVSRKVMEALAEKAPKLAPPLGEPIPFIFRCDADNGSFRGEDIAFFADCKALGFQPWLDPSISLGHVGSKVFKANFLEYMTQPTET